jgi:hypothetical protein
MMTNIAQVCFAERPNSIAIGREAQSAATNDGRANLPVCLNRTLGKRSDAGGIILGYSRFESAVQEKCQAAPHPAGTKAKCWRPDDFRFIN